MHSSQDPQLVSVSRTAEQFHAELGRISSELDRIIARARAGEPISRDLRQLGGRTAGLGSLTSRLAAFALAYDAHADARTARPSQTSPVTATEGRSAR